jgi:hypothetical protein
LSKKVSRLTLTLISIGLVLWLVVADLGKTNPGEISAPHVGIRTLLGGPTCSECHGENSTDLPTACLNCHEDVQADIQGDRGLHGNLETPGAMECALCHSEHHGNAFQLVSATSFSLAGIADVTAFQHDFFDYQLEGKHLEVECKACHKLAEVAALEEGQKRYMGLTQECTTCHEDPHEGRLQEDCASCHGQSKAFDLVATFEHDERFPLQGVHGEVGCKECHAKDDLHSVESMGGLNPPEWRTCLDCHESPHNESFLASSYAQFPNRAQDCSACHLLDHADFVAAREHCTKEDHAASGFLLNAPHDKLECEQCHTLPPALASAAQVNAELTQETVTLASFPDRFPGRQQDDCGSCHDDPHAGQFEQSTVPEQSCLDCHDRLHFSPALFDQERHRDTGFVLDGAHAQTECAQCHRDENPNDDFGPIYAAVDSSCQSCHTDAHDACFEEFAPRNDVAALDCNRCHTTASFAEVMEPGFDHGLWTAFPLEGKHASNDCETCHQVLPEATESGRTFGTATTLRDRENDSCDSCHEDVHNDRFNRPGLPTSVQGRESCARCHGQESFLPLQTESFDHGLWANYELRGAHARAKCESCHKAEEGDLQHGVLAAGEVHATLGTECSGCHDDPHNQRFDALNLPTTVNGHTSCARCHNEESFTDMHGAPFDHASWTGFALVDAHRFAECVACHGRGNMSANRNGRTPAANGKQRSLGNVADRFPGSTKQCSTCHTNPHGNSFRAPRVANTLNGKQGCARCHSQVSFRVAQHDFNHDRMTSFALRGSHANVDCSKCHRPLRRSGRDARSFDRARGTSCESCHADPHVGQFRNSKNDQCQDCHAAEGTFQTGLRFQHATHSRYRLDGAHDDLACSACHVTYPLANGRSVVRYRPLGTECSDCHGLR